MALTRCPFTLEQLLDQEAGRLDAAVQSQLAAHQAEGCPACAVRLQFLQRALPALNQAAGERLTENTRLALRELAAARFAPRTKPLWIALLLWDTRDRPQLAGARGVEQATQLRFEAENKEIRLWAEPEGAAGWYVIGQVIDRERDQTETPQAVALIGPDAARLARLEGDEFHQESLPSGRYQLRITLADRELLLPDIQVGG